MTDKITFSIRWEGQVTASLFSVIDNGVTKVVNGRGVEAKAGSVCVTYTADHAMTHRVEWSLQFAQHTLHGLKATATVNDGAQQGLGSIKEVSTRWNDSGVADT